MSVTSFSKNHPKQLPDFGNFASRDAKRVAMLTSCQSGRPEISSTALPKTLSGNPLSKDRVRSNIQNFCWMSKVSSKLLCGNSIKINRINFLA